MRRLLTTSATLSFLAVSASAEPRDLSGFNGVGVSDRIAVEVSVGPSYAVEVTGRDAARVRTRVEHGSLQISDAHRPLFGEAPRLDAVVHVTTPHLERLAGARGAEVSARGVQADEFAVAASMGAELQVSGSCSSLSAAASMGAIINAEDLHCSTTRVSASMGGVANVYASESYRASASMGGDIDVAGDAQHGEASTAMGGVVQHP